MSGIQGRQLAPNTITKREVDATIQVSDGSNPWTGEFDAGGNKLTNLGAPTAPNDAARLADVVALANGTVPHAPVLVISTSNLALTGLPIIDGYQTLAGDRILAAGQAAPVENGPYVAAAGAWARSADLTTGDNAQGAAFYSIRGTARGGQIYACNTPEPTDIVDTDPLSFIETSQQPRAQGDMLHRPCFVTVVDGDQAIVAAFGKANVPGSAIQILVNGAEVNVGNSAKVSVDCYVSGDGGATARNWNNIAAGDTVHWNGSNAGFQLALTDHMSVRYFSSN